MSIDQEHKAATRTGDALAEFNALVEFGEPGSVAAYVERLVNRARELEREVARLLKAGECETVDELVEVLENYV